MTGGLYDLGAGETRRRFLHALGVAGMGPVGLKRLIGAAIGATPDGVPLVWTRDRFGTPDQVRMVPTERYRRIQVYRTLDLRALRKRHGAIHGISLVPQSSEPSDLALKIAVERNTRSIRRAVPNRIRRVPTLIEERDTERVRTRVCRRRHLEFYDPLPANPKIRGYDEDENLFGSGTLGLVAWNADERDPYECFVTSHHVVEDGGETAPLLRHSGMDGDSGRIEDVGQLESYTPLGEHGLDGAKYRSSGAVTPAPLETASEKQGTVSGTWDFAGLTDATSGGRNAAPGDDSIPVNFAGSATCYAEAECVGTKRNSLLGYQAVIAPDVATDGDSGGPFIDSDAKLVCLFSTYCCGHNHGPVGSELLDRLGVRLHPS